MLAAFPDMLATLHQFVAESEYVAMRYSVEGTHRGDFRGIAATGRRVAFNVVRIQRIVDARIVEGGSSSTASSRWAENRWNQANLTPKGDGDVSPRAERARAVHTPGAYPTKGEVENDREARGQGG
jgi:hypothetical protein